MCMFSTDSAVLTERGYRLSPQFSSSTDLATKQQRFKIKRVPYAGTVIRITSTKGDDDVIVTPEAFILSRVPDGDERRTWTWKRAKYIRPGDYIGSLIPHTIRVVRQSSTSSRQLTAHDIQMNAIFAGFVRPVVAGKLGDVLDERDGFLDEKHAWFRVERVSNEPWTSFLSSAPLAIVENVAIMDFV